MRVIILTASFGGGHNSVAFALKRAFETQFSIEAEVCDLYEHLNPTINKITAKGYVWIMKRLPKLYGLLYNSTYDLEMNNFLNKLLSKPGIKELKKILTDFSPQGVVAVYPTYAGLLTRLKKEGYKVPKTFVVVTDFIAHIQWLYEEIDLYYVPTDEVKWHLVKKGLPYEKIMVTGIPIQPDFTELRSERRTLILISAGLFGMTPSVFEIGRALEEIAPPEFEILMLCGKDNLLYRKARDSFNRVKPIAGILSQRELAELMGKAVLLITKAGGLTVSEALSAEIPMIIYKPLPGQEFHNALYLLKNEAGLVAKNEKELRRLLKAFFEREDLRKLLRENIKRIRKPLSAYHVAKSIYDELQKQN